MPSPQNTTPQNTILQSAHPLEHHPSKCCVSAHVLSSLIDELMVMVPGEVSQFRCRQGDMVSGLFSVNLPPGEDLVIEVRYMHVLDNISLFKLLMGF